MNKLIEIKTAGKNLFKEELDEVIELIDFAYVLHNTRKRFIRKWIREHQIVRCNEEEIVYVHRYPKENETLIGVKNLKELAYFS